MNIEEKIEVMQAFAKKHGVELSLKGDAGFREAVGYLFGNSYVMYQPYDMTTIEPIPGFDDWSVGDCAPSGAHPKVQCLAVVLDNLSYEEAVDQLYEWTVAMEELDVEMIQYKTNAKGIQLMLSGAVGVAVRAKKQ